MMESKYLEFFKTDHTGKTEVYDVRGKRRADLYENKGYVLGHIKWYSPWRQYCFYPSPSCVFNNGCLGDISAFIKGLMEERKRVKAGV